MRTVIIMIFLLALFLGLYTTLGIGITMFIISGMYFIMATLFTIKKEYYHKYLSFVNPKYKNISDEKGEKFKKKNRITNIISDYILSVVMFFNGMINVKYNSNFKPSFSVSYYFKFGSLVLVIGIIIYFVNNFLLKKSKNHSDYVIWSILLGIVLAIIMISTITLIILT